MSIPAAPTKRARFVDFADSLALADDEAMGPPKKKKNRKGRTKKVKQTDGEFINIGDVSGGGDDDEGDVDESGPKEHQKRYYKGEKKTLMEAAVVKLRLYLLNMNAFPSADELLDWSNRCYVDAGIDIYGGRYQGMCITFTVSITFTLIYGRIALMPPFNAGIQKLVSAFHFPAYTCFVYAHCLARYRGLVYSRENKENYRKVK